MQAHASDMGEASNCNTGLQYNNDPALMSYVERLELRLAALENKQNCEVLGNKGAGSNKDATSKGSGSRNDSEEPFAAKAAEAPPSLVPVNLLPNFVEAEPDLQQSDNAHPVTFDTKSVVEEEVRQQCVLFVVHLMQG